MEVRHTLQLTTTEVAIYVTVVEPRLASRDVVVRFIHFVN